MKRFKNLVESVGSPASDQKQKKDDEKEVKGYKPRSKGEEDFANMHTVDKVNHPVAEPEQHTGDRKGPKSDTGEDHDGHEKTGQKVDKTYAKFMKMGGYGGSSKRASDKSDGDTKMPKIKEEVEFVDEAFKKGSLKLNSGETVKVNESDALALNNAFDQLNPSNKKRMETEAMKDKQSFEAMVKFAKSV